MDHVTLEVTYTNSDLPGKKGLLNYAEKRAKTFFAAALRFLVKRYRF